MPRREEPQLGLSRAIRHFRHESQLSQEALAFAAGLHPTSISHLESGRVNPTWGNVRRVAEGLGVPLPELAAMAEDLELKLGPAPRPGQGAGGQ
ncbi:MAG TPA: helix-turn-helix transcriptional regulator [Solirubrobacterales bacterium]|nr:helix-turn-helix transcriptional regulator [Solirubrobacterales bacterium]